MTGQILRLNIGFYRYSLLNRGGDRLSLAYANHLAALGHDVTLHVKEMDTVFDLSPALKVNVVECAGRAGFLLHAATHNLNHDLVIVDIIHLHMLLSLRNRVVYYAQADDVEYYDGRVMRSLVDVLYKVQFHSDTPVISMSQHLTDIFQRRYAASNIITLKTGIDHGSFYPEPDDELVRLKGEKKAVVLMARGDSYRKGFDISLQVLESLDSDAAAGMELWVCGNHLDGGNYKFSMRNFGVASDQRLRQILSSADIFFYPSRHEGFGLFPLEAMACGCVVVTTDAIPYASQTPSILVSPIGDVPCLVSCLVRIVSDNKLLSDMHKKAIGYAQSYDFEESKAAFANAVQTIVAGLSQ
jgi:glycosyltransferase involved in cell wall biosynthesis